MKHTILITALILPISSFADEKPDENTIETHREGSSKLAEEQDELSADVQQLILEQTMPQVIKLLEEVETIMDETTDRLDQPDTGGETIAAQTEIIEKIHAAAKERQCQSGSSQSGGAMMDMMERMMGKNPDGEAKKQGKGGQSGDQPGEGSTGLSDSANEAVTGANAEKTEARRIPKAAGNSGLAIPDEFREAFDAYNRGVEKKLK
jgi:hypothetical protein